jgi:hypothetical protein
LIPSFRRKFEKEKSKKAVVERIEIELIKSFREHYAKLEPSMASMPRSSDIGEENALRCLSVMQHYGVPTRLLDWTTDFWTAVYFACAGDPSHDAELWCYDRELFRERSAMIASGQGLTDVYASNSDPQILGKKDLKLVLEVGEQLTPRMRQQKAHHTVASEVLADHAPLIYATLADSDNKVVNGFKRVVIGHSCKDNVLDHLDRLQGISASSIFPDFEGLGRFLRWQLDSLTITLFGTNR